eukprot:TRINITY_DN18201_c0_g1_i1.p1 TRINITY_DN18201_c0_g1~~TRINITY_DN18201_c0_g1_i1.p1  ORF type:complete len:128 (-),score=31.61 TRINITY_DN18201_c0_g1_i1:362-745(-)
MKCCWFGVFIFFFFKQKTAYEMLRSLVGSEMCIRDRYDNGTGRIGKHALQCIMLPSFQGSGRLQRAEMCELNAERMLENAVDHAMWHCDSSGQGDSMSFEDYRSFCERNPQNLEWMSIVLNHTTWSE